MTEPSKSASTAIKVNRGLAWIGAASTLVGLLDLLALLIILNHWISVEDYGIATKCIWIFPILDYATDLGLSAAVIQRDDHSDSKISTVFWINLGTAVVLFAVIAVVAPFIATGFYGHAVIGSMLIAYGSKLIWQNVYFIPMALMRRELRFGELSVIRVIANFAEFAGKVGFAAAGFGVWCFVLGPLCRVAVTGVGCQLRHPWRPKLTFRFAEAKEYVTFGLRTSASQILFYFYTNVDYPIVGYYFGDVALGFYRLAYEVVLEPVRTISYVIVDVAFPAFAKLKHDHTKAIAQLVAFTKLNLIFVMAYSAVALVAADQVIAVIFPDFAGAESAIRILCIVAVFRAVGFVIPPLLDGMGYPQRTLRYMTTAAIALPVAYITGAVVLGDEIGFLGVAVAWACGYPIAFGVLIYMATSTLQWSLAAYGRAIGGVLACMVASGGVGFGVDHLLAGQAASLRLLATTIAIVVSAGLLLAYTQGISLRTVRRALRGDPV